VISIRPITICLTYFRSLSLANLGAALHSIRQQDMTHVESLVIIDNNTADALTDILSLVESFEFSVPVNLNSFKHGDAAKTHSWSTNVAVQKAFTPWILFTRADYLLDFDAVAQFAAAATSDNQFIVSRYFDVGVDIARCEQTDWRRQGPSVLQHFGREYDHVLIDAGVWMTRKDIFNKVGGMDETLVAWGHAQTVFQHKVYRAGVEFVKLPSVLFYHPAHGYETPRDHAVARQQLQTLGLDLVEMWSRYTGAENPYR